MFFVAFRVGVVVARFCATVVVVRVFSGVLGEVFGTLVKVGAFAGGEGPPGLSSKSLFVLVFSSVNLDKPGPSWDCFKCHPTHSPFHHPHFCHLENSN